MHFVQPCYTGAAHCSTWHLQPSENPTCYLLLIKDMTAANKPSTTGVPTIIKSHGFAVIKLITVDQPVENEENMSEKKSPAA